MNAPLDELMPWLLLTLPAAVPFGLTLLNLATWADAPREGAFRSSVSVLIPARDEAATIERCVRAVVGSGLPVREIVVCDDGSTDGTGDILRRLQAELPLLRVIQGAPLPPGWVGKVHATHQLAQAAQGELLLFLDADVALSPGGLARLAALAETPVPGTLSGHVGPPDVVTAVPLQRMGTAAERLLMPLLYLSYTAWLPELLVPRLSDPRLLAANGQLLLIRRAALDRIGGFGAVQAEVVDDMALCRRVKASGGQVLFADGRRLATCRMYDSGSALWRGFSKNLYEGVGGHPLALAFVVALHLACFVVPYLAVPIALLADAPAWALAGLAGVLLNTAMRGAMALRWGHPLWSVIAHPVGVLGLLGIAFTSMRWSRQGQIQWRGRSYAARPLRGAP